MLWLKSSEMCHWVRNFWNSKDRGLIFWMKQSKRDSHAGKKGLREAWLMWVAAGHGGWSVNHQGTASLRLCKIDLYLFLLMVSDIHDSNSETSQNYYSFLFEIIVPERRRTINFPLWGNPFWKPPHTNIYSHTICWTKPYFSLQHMQQMPRVVQTATTLHQNLSTKPSNRTAGFSGSQSI